MFQESKHNENDYDSPVLRQRDWSWKNKIISHTGGYRHPQIVNGNDVIRLEKLKSKEQIYVYVNFVKSGKHFYTVNHYDKFYLHKAFISKREEEVVDFNKYSNKRKVKLETIDFSEPVDL